MFFEYVVCICFILKQKKVGKLFENLPVLLNIVSFSRKNFLFNDWDEYFMFDLNLKIAP